MSNTDVPEFWKYIYLGSVDLMLEKWSLANFEWYIISLIWATTWQNQQNECAPSKDSDQPGHPPSLIRVFTVRLMGS